MREIGYPEHFFLRLDTDWFMSTYHELVHLWPRLVSNGILIIDDYGHWAGAKKAVDQYFREIRLRPFLPRIDASARLIITFPSTCRAGVSSTLRRPRCGRLGDAETLTVSGRSGLQQVVRAGRKVHS
jgi:hypothetical protein